jgi:prepilin-type N-terminal cleavage/methylation domain-containing protein
MRCLLFFLTQNVKQHTSQLGFTLMELLTVIALMAIIATVAITSYDGTQEQGRYDVTKFEMNQIRKALIQFRQDSGSNDFPTQGSYDCTDETNGGLVSESNSEFYFPTEAGTTDADKIAWCQHPANFWMLFTNPFDIDANPQKQWNIDTKRGWNGPYLQRKDGYLALDSNTVNLTDITTPVWAIADPYTADQTGSGVEWSVNTDSEILNKAALPYLLLIDLNNNYQARIVSAGDDSIFEANNNICETGSQALDQVLCLLN